MHIGKLAATATLAIAATGIAAATAYGQVEPAGPSFSAVDGPIAYTATVAPDRSAATVHLTSGKFVRTPDAGLAVVAPDGTQVATVPVSMTTVTGQQVRVAPEIDAAATTLTLTPVGSAVPEQGAVQTIGDMDTIVRNALIGCAIGGLIGLIFLVIGIVPGCVVGAIVGGVAGANQ
ncbi:hypothetical protein D5S18_27915 [Nocardia panacis]|uniref:DUF8020 domain-containing protein n=1 Tax=Nocardia panacis TaxID=2340916 RepID=A0A3A4K8I7_9NOCA|nr:hypothetical protein [Nocardia panacis]RJO70997.1 hypothetical protein D5S18_27915 [Nocardia panacis]